VPYSLSLPGLPQRGQKTTKKNVRIFRENYCLLHKIKLLILLKVVFFVCVRELSFSIKKTIIGDIIYYAEGKNENPKKVVVHII
jgi:hypothetical protein